MKKFYVYIAHLICASQLHISASFFVFTLNPHHLKPTHVNIFEQVCKRYPSVAAAYPAIQEELDSCDLEMVKILKNYLDKINAMEITLDALKINYFDQKKVAVAIIILSCGIVNQEPKRELKQLLKNLHNVLKWYARELDLLAYPYKALIFDDVYLIKNNVLYGWKII